MDRQNRDNLKEVVLLFLWLGFTAFGGPAAHLALYHEQVVKKRKWLDEQQFLDLIGATHLIPGPNSTEMVIYLSYYRAGWPGLILGGISFILPAMLIVMGLAWLYIHYGSLPQISGVLFAVKPIVIAIIAKALWFLGKKALKDTWTIIAALAVFGLSLAGFNNIALMLLAGLFMIAARKIPFPNIKRNGLKAALPFMLPLPVPIAVQPFSLAVLFLTFLKIGSVLYGSGYVLLTFLQSDLVDGLGWMSSQQIIDAVAVGEVTPGPLFTTATFIGYILGGVPGAWLATAGIFLPSFLMVALTYRHIPRLRESQLLGTLLDGVNAASLGLMAAVTLQLAQEALVDGLSVGLTAISIALVTFTNLHSTWLILAAVLIGLLRVTFFH